MFQHFSSCQVGSVQLFTNSRGGSSGSINSINDVRTDNTVSPLLHNVQYIQCTDKITDDPFLSNSVRLFLSQRKRPVPDYVGLFYMIHCCRPLHCCSQGNVTSQSDTVKIRSFLGNRSWGKFLFLAANKKCNLSYWQGAKPFNYSTKKQS